MESWQREIEVTKILYLEGKITCKYRGDKEFYLSNKLGRDHYQLGVFYDIEVEEIRQLSKVEYEAKSKELSLISYTKEISIKKGQKFFKINPIDLFIERGDYLEHVQYQDDLVHGYFEDCPVLYSVRATTKVIVCIPHHPTGNFEERLNENGKTEQRFEFIKNSECERYWGEWRKVGINPKCIAGERTGNKETKGNCVRYQFYNADCSTYWGEWECYCIPNTLTGKKDYQNHQVREEYYSDSNCNTYWGEWKCRQDYPTGNTRSSISGDVEREYSNNDCTTYWKKDPPPPPIKTIEENLGCRDGCASFSPLFFIFLLFLIIFSIIPSIIPLAIWLVFMLSYLLLSALAPFFRKFLGFIGIAIVGIYWLIGIAYIIFILAGLLSLFDFNLDYKPRRENQQTKETEYIPKKDTTSTNGESFVKIELEWDDYDKNHYKGVYKINRKDIVSSNSSLQSLLYKDIENYTQVYSNTIRKDSSKINPVYFMLDSIRVKNNLSKRKFADVIVTMVQSIPYSLVLTESCDDPSVRNETMIRQMLDAGIPCRGPQPFGILTPVYFSTELNGDCDTRTLYLYAILKHFGYDVVILNSNQYQHSMLGLNVKNGNGTYKYYRGKPYYFWETTAKNQRLGRLARENGIVQFWNVVLD
jgi:hypothetical protein